MAETTTPAVYLEEFLFRGRPPGSTEPPAYHIMLGVVGQDAFGRPTLTTSGALTPEQAEEHGISLPDALQTINGALIDENADLKARLKEREARIAALEEAAAEARKPPVEPAPIVRPTEPVVDAGQHGA